MQRARIIPVSGIGNDREAEQRAASAMLAVLTVVRDLSSELLSPLGASKAVGAIIECFTEVAFKLEGRPVRPDGLIRVTYRKSVWTALVEFKTGPNKLNADQINDYWDLARKEKFDHVITISNELAPMPGEHPTSGLRVRGSSPVQVSHFSWTAILSSAIMIKQHRGVEDPEQAWILGELIRYLEHPSSGALAFNDMGTGWVAVRDAARAGTLSARSPELAEFATNFEQLGRYAALLLGSKIGEDVTVSYPRGQREADARMKAIIASMAEDGTATTELRIPDTAGSITIVADIRARQIHAHTTIGAPTDRGAKACNTWLVKQLQNAPSSLRIDAFTKGARLPESCSLEALREDGTINIRDAKSPAGKYRLTLSHDMGQNRKAGGTKPGFIDSVLQSIADFYGTVLQDITEWRPKAPRIEERSQPETPASLPVVVEPSLYERYWATGSTENQSGSERLPDF